MEIREFCEKYGKKLIQMSEVLDRKYIPIEMKQSFAMTVMDSACYENGVLKVNSVARYVLERLAFVECYTTLERSDNPLEDFNLLNSIGFFEYLAKNIPVNERDEFQLVFSMQYQDCFTNEYEPHAYISGQVSKLGDILGTVLQGIFENMDKDKLNELLDVISQLDDAKK